MARFLGSRDDPDGCDWQILGLPYDATSSYRRGARFGPSEIRVASDSIETYSPYCRRDLEDLAFRDAGDLKITFEEPDEAVGIISDYYEAETGKGRRILGIGGEHTVTIGAIQGLSRSGLRPHVLHLDAHFDLRFEYAGGRNSHACVAARIAEIVGPERLMQWGMRSGERREFEWADLHGTFSGREIAELYEAMSKLGDRPVYLSLDLDLFDPAEMPGVGNPEPGGLKFTEFMILLPELGKLNIIGADVVEFAPVLDLSGRSAVMAAEIIRELLLNIAT